MEDKQRWRPKLHMTAGVFLYMYAEIEKSCKEEESR